MARRSFRGNGVATTLSAGISALDTTATVVDGSGLPVATNPFVITVNANKTSEEKILVGGRSGNTLTSLTRGYDGTTASSHNSGESVAHTISAVDLDEANAHINDTNLDQHLQYARSTKGVEAARTPGRSGKIRYSTDTDMLGFDDGAAYHDFPSKVVTDGLYLTKTGIAQAAVGTSETTASAAFTDLATAGPSVTVTVPASGAVIIILSGQIYNTTAFQYAAMGWVASGANTVAATEAEALIIYSGVANQYVSASEVIFKSGLTPGSTTFKAVYKAGGGTLTAQNRRILVIPC